MKQKSYIIGLLLSICLFAGCSRQEPEKMEAPEASKIQEEAPETSGEPEEAWQLSDQGMEFLQQMCWYLPEFSGEADLTEAFWLDFLFRSYTGASGEDREAVYVWRADLQMDEMQIKVSEAEVAADMKLALGVEWPGYKPALSDMEEGQTALYYADGDYYIGVSDFPAYDFTFAACEPAENGQYRAEFRVVLEAEEELGSVYFTLEPAENEHGFVITGRENAYQL